MKVIIAVLALACGAFAMPGDREKRDSAINVEALKNSCPGKCLNQDKYRQTFSKLAPSGKEVARKFAVNKKPSNVVPPVTPQELEQCCTEVETIKTCVSACNDPADAETKRKAEAILASLKDLVCDAEIKQHITCLSTVDDNVQEIPEACKACEALAQPAIAAANQTSKPGGGVDWDKVKIIGKSVCEVTNCVVKCSKSLVEQKCQAAGYTAFKTLLKKTAALLQTIHAQFRPEGNYPNECKPDAIIAGA